MRLGTHNVSLPGLLTAAAPPTLVGAALVWVRIYHPEFIAEYKEIFTPVAGMIAAVAAVLSAIVVASFTAEANTRNAKVKAAWDALAKKQWDKDYIAARETYVQLQRRKTAFSKYARKAPDGDEQFVKEFEAVLNIANDYEIMAAGIEKHVLDEGLIRDTFRTAWIDDYKTLAPFFDVLREETGNDRYFEYFRKYSQRWKKLKEVEQAKKAESEAKHGVAAAKSE